MTDLSRAFTLSGYERLVQSLGGDPEALLGRFGLVPGVFDEPDRMLLSRDIAVLLEHSAKALECPDFGIQIIEAQELGVMGPMAIAVRNCGTVADAIQFVARYFGVMSSSVRIGIDRDRRAGMVRVNLDISIDGVSAYPQIVELVATGISRIMDVLSQGAVHKSRVDLPHPPQSRPSTYRRHFGCPVRFGADRAVLHIPDAEFEREIPGGDAVLQHIAQAFIDRQYQTHRADLVGQVRHLVGSLLPTGACTVAEIARSLHLHPRTLHRRLSAEGTTFEGILDQVRAVQAERLLAQSHIPLGQLSALLGYSEQSSLSRSCQRWFGRSPSAVRRRLVSGQE